MKKTIFLLIITILLITSCKKEKPINYECIDVDASYLSNDYYIDSGLAPKGTWDEKSCPSGKKVIYIDLLKTEDNSAWRRALYCEKENYFWIADFDNTRLAEKIKWYGVFDERPCGISE